MECRDAAFLGKAVDLLVGRLAPDGLGYVIAPRRWRASLLRRLREANLHLDAEFAHLPADAANQHLVPLDGRHLRYVLAELMSGRPVVRFLLLRLLPTLTLGILGGALPQVGIVVRRTGARSALGWVNVPGVGRMTAVIQSRWGKKGGTAILHFFPGPSHVGKITLSGDPGSRVGAEATALEHLGARAMHAGARVPAAVVVRTATGRPLLVANRLEGRQAAQLLRRGSVAAVDVMTQLATWLERWNRSTRVLAAVDAARLHEYLFEPAARLAPLLGSGAAYLEWLRALGDRAVGSMLPIVAAHNDLTMVNVLLQHELPPGIIDWEMADARGLPLADFCYAAVDAVATARRGSSRAQAFARCFRGETVEARTVWRLIERIRAASDLADDLVPLCFHACWLHHAANEVRRTPAGPPGPFLGILRSLAEDPTGLPGRPRP